MKQDRKAWFRGLKGLIRIFVKKTKFVYLGEEPKGPSLILSNHVGALGPLSFELYFPYRMRFWGTYEMNGSLREVYRYAILDSEDRFADEKTPIPSVGSFECLLRKGTELNAIR